MNSYAEYLLQMIDEAADGLLTFITTPPGKLRFRPIPRATYYATLNRLEKRGMILKKKSGSRSAYFLTAKGRGLLHKPIQKRNRQDGLSTIIIFDIPEEKSRQRTIFRRHLQRSGYINLQKSVLIAPFIVTDDIKQIIKELNIRPHVSIIDGKINYNF